MIAQPALGEFAIDAAMGIHFFLHTPKVFLACRVRQLYAHYEPQNPEEVECQQFLQGYGLQIEKSKQSGDSGLTRDAIDRLLRTGWDLLGQTAELDPWSGKIVTLRRRFTWPTAEGRGWEVCTVNSNRGTAGPYLVLEREGHTFDCDLDLIYGDAQQADESARKKHDLLSAYGWLASRVSASRNFIGTQSTASTPASFIPAHYLICLLLRQTWEPVAYGQKYMGPLPWRIKFRRPVPAADAGPAMDAAWGDWLAIQTEAATRK